MKRFILFLSLSLALVAHTFSSIAASASDQDQGLHCPADPNIIAVIEPGLVITLKELDESVGKQILTLKEKMYALRRNALDNLINHVVLEREAQRSGLKLDALRKQLASSDEANVSEHQIKQAYAENVAALASLGEDEAKERIRLDIETQARLRSYRARLADLRSQTNIRMCLEEPSLPLVSVSNTGPARGPSDAKVTIIEYSDFQCPYCRQAAATLGQLLQLYKDKVRLVFKHLPLPIHPQAFRAAQAAYCAEQQDRFWEYHDRLFAARDLSDDRFNTNARELNLDIEKFTTCLQSETARSEVLRDVQEARQAGFQGTPTFVVNGKVMRGAVGLDEFKRVIDRELESRRKED